MIKVNSSNIDSVSYDNNTQELDVLFKSGDYYRYLAVPQGIYEKLLLAKSKGQYFHAFVKNAGYEYKKIDVEDETVDVFRHSLSLLERAGLAKREMDEEGNLRITLLGDYVKEALAK